LVIESIRLSELEGKDPDRTDWPIGVFDSGLGGMRVLDRLIQAFPAERFVYLGDTQHMPYGHKSHAEVQGYVADALHWFFTPTSLKSTPVKMMLVACNTASAVASDQFAGYAPAPFIDPVTSMCRWLVDSSRYQNVGILATPATVASNRYRQVLDALTKDASQASTAKQLNDPGAITLTQVGCEHLATVIEEGGLGTPACEELLVKYLAPLQAAEVEAIVLGCTHYPYAEARIAALAPQSHILDPDIYMVMEVARLLKSRQLATSRQAEGPLAEVDYFVTAEPNRFFETSRRMPFRAIAMKPPTVIDLALSQEVTRLPVPSTLAGEG
jgi:glutamate racemase